MRSAHVGVGLWAGVYACLCFSLVLFPLSSSLRRGQVADKIPHKGADGEADVVSKAAKPHDPSRSPQRCRWGGGCGLEGC